MVPNSPFKPRKTYLGFNIGEIKLIATVVLVVVAMLFFFYGPDLINKAKGNSRNTTTTSVSNTKVESTPQAVEETPVVAETTSPTPAPFDWKTAEVNEENVKRALSESKISAAMAVPFTDKIFRKYVDSYDTKGKYVQITINQGAFYDEKDFVKKAGGSLIEYSRILFQNPQVYEVSIVANIDNVAGGENKGVYISWQREQAEGVDYAAIIDNMFGDITIPYQLARNYRIEKDIYDKLKDFDLPAAHNP